MNTELNWLEENEAIKWMVEQNGNFVSTMEIGKLVIIEYNEKSPGIPFILWYNLNNKNDVFSSSENDDLFTFMLKQVEYMNSDISEYILND